MLRHFIGCLVVYRLSDPAIRQELSIISSGQSVKVDELKSYEFWGMRDISYIRLATQLCQQLRCPTFLTLQDQCRVITEFPEVLQTLKDMLILPLLCSPLNFFTSFIRCCRSGVFVV
jgi:hypothetical protein